RPDFGKDNVLFPQLPEIHSPAIRLQVFTHRSFFARPTHIFEDHHDDPSPDNEKFEHLGDTVLGLTITNLLMNLFPGLRVGPSTKIRAMIVGNPTLAEISLRYKLPDRLRLHPAQAITLRASTNIQADVFESFIGGLYLDQGLEAVKLWIDPLFIPYACAAYHIARQQHGLPPMPPSFHLGPTMRSMSGAPTTIPAVAAPHPEPSELLNMPTIGHLALFNQHLQKTSRQVEWIYSDGGEPLGNGYADVGLPPGDVIKGTKTTPVWYVKVMVDGIYHGRGRGNTKKAARNEAAKEGLEKMGIRVW
ncbi:ribonuclease III domain-containing protein, partial [Crassisporium funariophilum]